VLIFGGMTSSSSKRQCIYYQDKGKAPVDDLVSLARVSDIDDLLNQLRFSSCTRTSVRYGRGFLSQINRGPYINAFFLL